MGPCPEQHYGFLCPYSGSLEGMEKFEGLLVHDFCSGKKVIGAYLDCLHWCSSHYESCYDHSQTDWQPQHKWPVCKIIC